jgi:hypothetical protein
MEHVNTHRTKEGSPPESDEAAHLGRFSEASQRRGEEASELLTEYSRRLGRGRLLTHHWDIQRAECWSGHRVRGDSNELEQVQGARGYCGLRMMTNPWAKEVGLCC